MSRTPEGIDRPNRAPKNKPSTPKEYTPTPEGSIVQIFGGDTLCEMEKFGLSLPVLLKNPETKKNEIHFNTQEGLMHAINDSGFKIIGKEGVSLTSDTVKVELVEKTPTGNLSLKATNQDGTFNTITFAQGSEFKGKTPDISICF